jgi:hypothetical protein
MGIFHFEPEQNPPNRKNFIENKSKGRNRKLILPAYNQRGGYHSSRFSTLDRFTSFNDSKEIDRSAVGRTSSLVLVQIQVEAYIFTLRHLVLIGQLFGMSLLTGQYMFLGIWLQRDEQRNRSPQSVARTRARYWQNEAEYDHPFSERG